MNYFEHRNDATEARIVFWLRELRTPELLMESVSLYPDHAAAEASRPAVAAAIRGDMALVTEAISYEEAEQRRLDREYWAPLRAELESLRRQQRK